MWPSFKKAIGSSCVELILCHTLLTEMPFSSVPRIERPLSTKNPKNTFMHHLALVNDFLHVWVLMLQRTIRVPFLGIENLLATWLDDFYRIFNVWFFTLHCLINGLNCYEWYFQIKLGFHNTSLDSNKPLFYTNCMDYVEKIGS